MIKPCLEAPSASVLAYDLQHLTRYADLLDAERRGVNWREAATRVLGLSLDDPDAAYACWASHVERARWVTGKGLGELLAAMGAQVIDDGDAHQAAG